MSLTTRAIVAIALMLGFYLLALGLIAGLIWIPYAEWTERERVSRLGIICVIGAGAILWSILPRFDRFRAPGPRVTAADQPQLFAEISSIAKSVGQEMPHDVYLVPEVNAWVAQRGGVMGLGSHRVMALGLPLLALLTVSQFRAVLTHEFGHYYGGDTKLGPWIYRTRAAIIRTVTTLGRTQTSAAYLAYLFKWYAEMFLRITLAISRAQEYAADKLAAHFAGSKAMMEGLKQLHRGSVAWNAYLQTEVGPVVQAGYAPPLSAGLSYFLAAPQVSGPVNESLEKELAEGKADPYDSHPALPERIAALREIPEGVAEDSRPALELISDISAADVGLVLAEWTGSSSLQTVRWEHVLERVWAPAWQGLIDKQRAALEGLFVRDLGSQKTYEAIGARLRNLDLNETRTDLGRRLCGCALALVLLHEGWTSHMLPGEAYFEKSGYRLEPFHVIAQLVEGKMSQQNWEEICKATAIGDLPLINMAAAARS